MLTLQEGGSLLELDVRDGFLLHRQLFLVDLEV